MNISLAHQVDNATLRDLASPLTTVALPVIYLFVIVVSTPCNLLCLILLCTYTKRKTPTIIFAINLSLVDILYSVSLPLQVIYHFSGNNWNFSATACGFTTVAFHCSMQCSVLITCAIAVERYLGVVHPMKAKHWCKPWRAGLVCLLIWGVVLTVQTPLMRHDLRLRVQERDLITCFDVMPRETFGNRKLTYLYFGSVFLLSYAVPLVILMACYVAVTRGLRHSPQTDSEDYTHRYAMIMCAIAAVSFVIFYLPNVLLQILHLIYRSQNHSLYPYYKFTHGINSLNCCVDPFVYYLASREFRNTLRKSLRLFQYCGQCDSDELSTPSEMASLSKPKYSSKL